MPDLVKQVVLTIPIPPSANAIWRAWRGRILRSKRYEAWRWECSLLLGRQPMVETPCSVEIVIYGGKGFTLAHDLDNLCKPTLDLLRLVRVIPEDSAKYVELVQCRYVKPKRKGDVAACKVWVTTLEDGR